jgi:hypothetical protein
MNDNHSNGTPPGGAATNGEKRPNAAKAAKREVAAMFLASGKSRREAAREAGVGERSLCRWLREDHDFVRKVREHRSDILAEVVGKLASIGGQSVAALAELLGRDQPPGIRLRAAVAVLGALVPGYRVLEERQVCELAEKTLHHASVLDAEWARLKLERQQLDDERQKLRSNGVGGLGHGR